MALYKYTAVVKNREDFTESGTVVADDETQAKKKLERLDFTSIHLKKMAGISAIVKQFSADVK